MGRTRAERGGVSLENHLELGMELSAIHAALQDVRKLFAATEGSAGDGYKSITRMLRELKNLAAELDRDLQREHGAKIELRKTYREIVP
jgi:hypothetical protein